MSPQVSIFGIAIIAIFYTVGSVILVTLNQLIRSKPWRRLVIVPLAVLVVAAPWADELWITWRFSELCKDAGIHVTRRVEAEGFYDDTLRSGYERIDRVGYTFMEHRSADGKWVEHIVKLNGEWHTSKIDQPTARFRFKRIRGDVDAGYQLEAIEYAVIDSDTGEIIARNAIYKRYPGWVNTLWMRYFGSGMTMCPDPGRGPRQPRFPESVLIPIRAK